MTEPAEHIDFLYRLALDIIKAKKFKDEEGFSAALKQAAQSVENIFNVKVSPGELQETLDKLYRKLPHTIGPAVVIADHASDSRDPDWFQKFLEESGSPTSRAYHDYLYYKGGWSLESLQGLDSNSNRVMEKLGNPGSHDPFQIRGLLLGEVQSGKTANYTDICAKAVDAGYKVIIVLAGITESLRIQTQGRLDSDLAGKTSVLEKNARRPDKPRQKTIGIRECSPDADLPDIIRFTSVFTDFDIDTLLRNNLSLNNFNGAALFVVKKNLTILSNLMAWFTKEADDKGNLIDFPLLMIDDEADNASVNTNKEDLNPTAVNSKINAILGCFKQASYVGVTATPFANILMDTSEDDDGKPLDLFPKDFIALMPPPDNYIGSEKIFGSASDDEDRKPPYAKQVIYLHKDETEPYLPLKHKKTLKIDGLPESLIDAICYFIFVCAVSDARGDQDAHRSMLVNVSRFTDVQNRLASHINEKVLGKLRRESFFADHPQDDMYFQRIMKFFGQCQDLKIGAMSWEDFVSAYIFPQMEKIKAVSVNQSSDPKEIDFKGRDKKEGPLRVIAVGGNSLSRGLTLEGLCVSYFYRGTSMYDTLMQMGRWFGYRRNYEDLFRIWIRAETADWFSIITEALIELKDQIEDMSKNNETPKEFGLRVKQSEAGLFITAKNKMRLGSIITVPVRLAGRLIETPRLNCDIKILEDNSRICLDFIKKLFDKGYWDQSQDPAESAIVFKKVPKDYVLDLIGSFKCHPWNLNFQSRALGKYIEEDKDGSLEEWDVAVPHGEGEPVKLPGANISIRAQVRQASKDFEIADMIKIGGRHVRIGSRSCTKLGLSPEQIQSVNEKYDKSKLTDKSYLGAEGRRPLLLVHVLQPVYEGEGCGSLPRRLFGIGLGFPGLDHNERTANYVINCQQLQTYCDEFNPIDDMEE